MVNFSQKLVELFKKTIASSTMDDLFVIYDITNKSHFGRNIDEDTKFKSFVNNITTTHTNDTVKLVYIGRSDFNWMMSSTATKDEPLTILAMPYAVTYVFSYTDSTMPEVDDESNKIEFVYISSHKATHTYKKE